MDVTKVVDNVAEAVTEEVSNETKSIFKKVKRWFNIILLAYAVFVSIAIYFSFRNNTNLVAGLEEAEQFISELSESNRVAEIAVNTITNELSRANEIIGSLENTNNIITGELERLRQSSGSVGDRASDIDKLNREFAEIIDRYNTGSSEARETEQIIEMGDNSN